MMDSEDNKDIDNEELDNTDFQDDNYQDYDNNSFDNSSIGYSPYFNNSGFGNKLSRGPHFKRSNDDLKDDIEKNKTKNTANGNANQNKVKENEEDKRSYDNKEDNTGDDSKTSNRRRGLGLFNSNDKDEVKSETALSRFFDVKFPKGLKLKIIIVIVVVAVILLFFIVFAGAAYIVLDSINNGNNNGDSNGSTSCISGTYSGKTCNTITVSGYGTMSLDDYVAGVAKSEVGVFNDLEMSKIGAIAARSFVLSHKGSSCVVTDTTESFQVYKGKGDALSIQAANETSGIVLTKDGNIHNAMYDAFCWDSKDSQYYYVCQGHGGTTPVPIEWANRVVPRISGSKFLGSRRYRSHGQGLSQDAAYYLSTEQKKSYQEILDHFYGDEGVVLSSFGSADTSGCGSSNNGNAKTLSNYTLNHEGLKVLDRRLTSSEISQFVKDIESAVNSAGYGTGAAVAAAGQTLAYDFEKLGYYLRYGYGHRYASTGINPNWDANTGLDCSGFVSWAIINSCNKSFGDWTADSFYQRFKNKQIDLKDAKPGDVMLLVENKGGSTVSTHIRLVVKNNGDGSIVTLEEALSAGGLVFKVIKSDDKFITVDMSDYYRSSCTK